MQMFPTPDAVYAIGYQYHSLPTPITNASTDNTNLDVRFPRVRVQALIAGACLFFPHYLAESQRAMLEQTSGMTLAMMQQRANVSGVSHRQQQSYFEVMRERNATSTWPTTIYTGAPVR